MNPNDPTTFPRYIPDAGPSNEISELVAQYEGELRDTDVMKAVFESEGWTRIAEHLRREAVGLDTRAQKEADPQQWFLYRGQAMTLWYLLELPDRVEKLRRRLMDDYRRLVGESEDG